LRFNARGPVGLSGARDEGARPRRHGIQFNDHIEGDGAEIFAPAYELGFEGIVSKDRACPYRSGPSKTWLKIKNLQAPGVLRFQDRDAPA
jgi:ATP-dependent DNA ligase